MHLTFIIGGARSGKSAFAQHLAQQRGEDDVLFVATLRENARENTPDAEMQRRIKRHRAARPASWPTMVLDDGWREQLHSAPAVSVALFDCLSLFVSGALFIDAEAPVNAEDQAEALACDLLVAMRAVNSDWIVVSNEVGMAGVPEHPAARSYRDALGRANQVIMRVADEAYLLVAGAPLKVK